MSTPQDGSHEDAALADASGEAVTTVPLVEERLEVGVRERSTGRVRIATRTETVERLVEETLSQVNASVTRVPVDRELEAGEPLPETRVEGGVTIMPVLEERLVVEKRLVLVEEVRIELLQESEEIAVPFSLRRQRVDIERLPVEGPSERLVPDPSDPTES